MKCFGAQMWAETIECDCGEGDCAWRHRLLIRPFCDALAKLCSRPPTPYEQIVAAYDEAYAAARPIHYDPTPGAAACGANWTETGSARFADVTCKKCQKRIVDDGLMFKDWPSATPPGATPAPQAEPNAFQEALAEALAEALDGLVGLDAYVGVPRYGGTPWAALPAAPPELSLAKRYAAFRETVERVVKEEAPRARVVTDKVSAIGRERPDQFTVYFEWGPYRRQWAHAFDAPTSQFESSIRQHCEGAIREAGMRAMGKL